MKRKLPRALSVDEANRLLAATAHDPVLHALTAFLWDSGCRLGEALALAWTDLDIQNCSGRVNGKGGDQRLVLFTRLMAEELEALRQRGTPVPTGGSVSVGSSSVRPRQPHQGAPGGHVFAVARSTYQYRLARAGERAGLGHVWPHLLRHTFATHLLDRGAPLPVVAELMGHRNWDTTANFYWQLTEPRLYALRQTINSLPYFAHKRLSHPAAFVDLHEGRLDP